MTREEIIADERYHTCGRCRWGDLNDDFYPCNKCNHSADKREDLWQYAEEVEECRDTANLLDLGVDCIDRQATLDTIIKRLGIKNESYLLPAERTIYQQIKDMPAVTPQEPRIGHWIGIDEEPHEDYECDKCGYIISTYTANIEPHTEYKYCPSCGAKMIEPQESEE